MKAVKVILFLFFLIIVLCGLFLFIFLKSFDAQQSRAYFVRELSAWSGREVKIADIDLKFSLSNGIALELKDIEVGDHPGLPYRLKMKGQSLRFGVDIREYLRSRSILITDILIQSPEIEYVMQEDDRATQGSLPADNKSRDTVRSSSSQQKESLSQLQINHVALKDGSCRIRGIQGVRELDIKDIDLDVKGFSLSKNFDIKFAAALWGGQQNITFDGKMLIDGNNDLATLSEGRVSIDVGLADIEQLGRVFPKIFEMIKKEHLAGRLNVDIDTLGISPNGLESLSARGEIDGGSAVFKAAPVKVRNLKTTFFADEKDIKIINATADLNEGRFSAKANAINYLSMLRYDFDFNLKGLELEPIVREFNKDITFIGQLYQDLSGNGLDLPLGKPGSQFSGSGKVYVENGKLKDVNILKLVLSRVAFIPNLADKILENLPEKYKEKLKKNETVFNKIETIVRGQNEGLVLSKMELGTDMFSWKGEGSLSWGQRLQLLSAVYIPADLSEGMVKAVPELGAFLNSQGQLVFPLKPYNGPLQNFTPMPDYENIVTESLKERGKQELREVLKKAMGRDEEPSGEESPEGEGTDPQQQPEKASPEEQIVDFIFDEIFK